MGNARLVLRVGAAQEPVSLAQAKLAVRVDTDDEDLFIAGLIASARQMCESITGRSFMTQEYSLFLDRWPHRAATEWWDGIRDGAISEHERVACVDLPRGPVASVDEIRVYAQSGSYAVVDTQAYRIENASLTSRVVLQDGATVPQAQQTTGGIEIRYTSGYGDTADTVPPLAVTAMLQLIADMYQNRGDMPGAAHRTGIRSLLMPLKTPTVV